MKTLTQPSLLKDISVDWLTHVSKNLGEAPWVLDLRVKAFQQFEALPWPTARDERWKRAELNLLSWDTLQIDPDATAPAESAPWISLKEALKTRAADVKAALESAIAQASSNKFMSLNLALAFNGACLFVPGNQQMKTTFPSLSSLVQGETAHFQLNVVVAEEGADLQLWDEMENAASKGVGAVSTFLSTFTSIHLKENSHLSFYGLQHWNETTAHFQFQQITQDANSKFNAVAVAIGGRIFRHESTLHLNGQCAENNVLGVLFGDGKQNFENWITQLHTGRRTTSDIQYRGALKGSAQSFFSGLVSIAKEAQQSDAFQSSKSLLLSKDARADAIPNLEILADDVKCAHGAAVGSVDEDQKFYLQTRGVRPEEAEHLIIEGFFETVIAAVPSEPVQEKLRAFVDEKLGR